ncbi:MAG: hypothetical protein RMK74_10845, partial [Myxococcales bacterium]|nr:hypothetical protein [Myxococcales bacterium]
MQPREKVAEDRRDVVGRRDDRRRGGDVDDRSARPALAHDVDEDELLLEQTSEADRERAQCIAWIGRI